MNEELLQAIHQTYFADKGDYVKFKNDFTNNPEMRRAVHSQYFADKGDFNKFEADLGLGQSAQAPVQPQPEAKQSSFWGKLGNALKVGWDAGKTVDEGIDLLTYGKGADEETKQALSAIIQRQNTLSPEESFQKIRAEKDGSWKGFMELTAKEKMGYIAELGLQSGAQMVSSLLDSFTSKKTAAVLAGGAGAGAAAGSVIPILGTALGTGLGTFATVSGLMEASQFVMEELQTELQKRGLKGTVQDIDEIASNDEWMNETRRKGALKGIAIGTTDFVTGLVSGGIGAKTVSKVFGKGLSTAAATKTVLKGAAKAQVVDAFGGGLGERLGQIAADQPYDYLAIEGEVLGEFFMSPYEFGSPFIKPLLGGKIVDAKNQRITAEKTGTPITKEIEDRSNEPLGVSHLVEGIQTDNLEMVKHSLATLAAAGHDVDTFSGMLQIEGKIRGLSPEAMQAVIPKYEATLAAAQKFNTPELQKDPVHTALATKARLDITQAETAETQLEEQKAAADPSLHPKYDEQIQAVREVKADLEETLGAIVAAPKLEVSDDPAFYKTRLDELETTKTTVKNESSAKTQELLELGAVLQDTISSAISEEYGETVVVETPAAVQKVLYDGVEYEVTKINKDGSFDLSSRDGKFVKAAEKTDAEWQGFVGEPAEATTTSPLPPVKKEKKSSAVTRLEKAAAAIKGSPIAQIESIGALLNITSIPDFIYAKIGDGDISAGKAVVQKAKDLHGEVKAFQSKLAGGKFFSDLDRQIAETRSRIETLEKQPTTRQIPAAETPAMQQEPATPPTEEQKLDDLKNKRIATFTYKSDAEVPDVFKDRITSRSTINGETTIRVSMPQSEADYLLNQTSQVQPQPDVSTTNEGVNDGINDGVSDGVNTSPPNLPEESVVQEEETPPVETQKKLEDLSKEVTMKAQTASDLYLINRRIWGLNHEQAIETAVIQDRLVTEMAKRAGISKTEMYKRLPFTKNPTSIPGNALYQIIGESAKLTRQVLTNLGLAQRQEKLGRTSSYIHNLTGWERSSDGKWRYKINFGKLTLTPESLATMPKNLDGNPVTTLGEIYDAPELFTAYPQLREVEVVFDKKIPPGNGGYDGGIRLSYDQVAKEYRGTSLTSVLVHEIQHVVQDIEGFAQGVGASTVDDIANYINNAGEVEARAAQKMLGLSPEEIRNARLIDLYDVHPDYQIIQFGSDYSSLSPVLPPNEERQQIEAQAKKDGTWMKAPNGKPTNLNEQQWVTVRTKAFKDWFGDWEGDPQNASKVVDANGEPMVVYHGTRSKSDFYVFDDREGDKQSEAPQGSSFFTDKYDVARSYSFKVYEVFLNIRDPNEFDFEGADWQGDLYGKFEGEYKTDTGDYENIYTESGGKYFNSKKELVDTAKEQGINVSSLNIKEDPFIGYSSNSFVKESSINGNDGAIMYDIVDNGGNIAGDVVSNVYVVFNPNQIKLADGTNTAFDPNTGDIRFQKDPGLPARGAMAIQSDGIAVMYALTNPNVSTPVHELVHVFERYLTDAEKQTVLAEFGGNEWTTETSEFFARGFERYLLDGVAPTPELQTTFEKFKKWLTGIYLGIRNSVIDTPISVRMENLYASFLTDKEFHNATEKPRVFSTEDKLRGKINQEELDSLRKTIELSDIPPGQTQHIDDMIQESYEKYVTENPLLEGGIYAREEKLAKDALNGLPMDAPMQLALANVINKLRQAHLRETQNLSISKQQGDKKGLIRSISDKIDAIEDQLDMFTRALYKARSVSGRALGIGSKLIDFNAFDEVNMRAKLGERLGESGKTLSEADKAFIKDLSSKINQEVQDIAALDIKDQEAGTKTKMIIAESQISQMKKSKMAKRTQSVLAAKANLDRILKGNIC